MWRDRWFAVGAIGAVVACLSCFTSFAVIVLSAIGLGGWAGHLDIVALPLLAASLALLIYRYRTRTAPRRGHRL